MSSSVIQTTHETGAGRPLPTEPAESSRNPDHSRVVLSELLASHAVDAPDRVFATFGDGDDWTVEQAATTAWSVANGLALLGVRQGDHVGTWLPTSKDHIAAWFGINALGSVFVPINTALRGSTLEHVIVLSGMRLLVAHASLVDRLLHDDVDLGELTTVVVVGGSVDDMHEAASGRDIPFDVVAWSEVASTGGLRPAPERAIRKWDPMALLTTSGTTGPSKLVVWTYLHPFCSFNSMFPPEAFTAEDRLLLATNLFHASGCNSVFGALSRGGSLAVPSHGFSTARFWDDAREMGATTAILMGAMMNFLEQADPSPRDNDNPMKNLLVAPLLPNLETFAERFGIERIHTVFASTEMASPLRSAFNPSITSSVGRLVEGYQVRLVDEFDQEVAVGEAGELLVRNDVPWTIAPSYYGMPEATEKLWRNGWLHTGDALRRDADGNYYFVDRVKDAIRRRGENISSVEVESALLAHPSITEAAVVGVPADGGEEDVLACVVTGDNLDFEALVGFLAQRMPYYSVPRYFVRLDALPRTPSLRVKKFELRESVVHDRGWDREAAGLRLTRERFDEPAQTS